MAYNVKEIEEKLTLKCTFWSYIFPSIERKFLTQNFDESIRIASEIAKIAIDKEETYLRSNFSQSDNRNFRDGDKRSSRSYRESFDEGEEKKNVTNKMYNSPKHTVEVDSADGKMVREYDKSNSRTSLINDEVRVYKGGSWKDREYWLDPAQRRYFPQDMATDYIGFRCAMSRVGSKSKGKTKKKN